MIKNFKMLKVGDHGEVPGPEVYWMKDFGKWVKLCFYSFMVDTNDGYLLVNTGLPKDLTLRNKFLLDWAGTDRCRFSFTKDEMIDNALKRNGVSPADIAHVIITPIQDYTIGSLDHFKNAKIYFSRRGWHSEIANSSTKSFVNRDMYFPQYIRRFVFDEAWDRVVLVEDQEIVDGVSVRWTGGHHRSSMSVLLGTKEGSVAITDAAFTSRNLEENIPIGIAENIFECYDAYDLLKRSSKVVIPSYDPENIQRFKNYVG